MWGREVEGGLVVVAVERVSSRVRGMEGASRVGGADVGCLALLDRARRCILTCLSAR